MRKMPTMMRWCVMLWTACLGATVHGQTPLDMLGPDDLSPTIAWKDTWQQTLEHNTQTWRAALTTQMKIERERRRALAARELALLDAMAQRYGKDRDAMAEVARRRVAAWRELGVVHRQSVEAIDVAMQALGDNHGAVADLLAGYAAVDGQDDVALRRREYAHQQLVRLVVQGRLAATDARHVDAALAVAQVYRKRGWLAAARDVLMALDAAGAARGVAVFDAEADLLWWAGDGGAANAMREQILPLLKLSPQRESDVVSRHRRLYESAYIPSSPPLYAVSASLKGRIEQIVGSGPALHELAVQGAFEQDPYADALLPREGQRHESAWRVLTEHLRQLPAESVASLRQLQQQGAAAAALDGADDLALMQIFRRFPLSRRGAEAVLALGERALWRGHTPTARRCFEDVLALSDDAALRRGAEEGMRLAQDAAATTAAPPARGAPLVLQLPDVPLWPQSFMRSASDELLALRAGLGATLTTFDGGIVAMSPGAIARYDAGRAQPRWAVVQDRPLGDPGDEARHVLAPASMTAEVSDGRVFARWGLEESRQVMAHVVALDLGTGAMQWTTQDDPGWDDLWPVSDPLAAEGGVYVLAMNYPEGRRPLLAPLELVCLDAADGRTRWRRLIGTQSPELILGTRIGPTQINTADVSHYGGRLAFHQGAVYCSTNMSMIARIDARDGLIEWVRDDERIAVNDNWPVALRRDGGTPTIVGDLLIVAPRDLPGLMAIHRHTGRKVWHDRYLPSLSIIGRHRDMVLTRDDAHVAAVRAADGRVMWSRRFDGGLDAAPLQHGDHVVVASGGRIVRVEATTGRLDPAAVSAGVRPAALSVAGGGYAIAADEPASLTPSADEPAPTALRAAARRSPQLPLQLTWEATRTRPRLFPPPGADDRRIAMAADTMLELIDLESSSVMAWRRRIPPGLRDVVWGPRHLLLVFVDRVQVIDLAGGALHAEHVLSHPALGWLVMPSLLVVHDVGRRSDARSGITAIELDGGGVRWQRDLLDHAYWWIEQSSHHQQQIVLGCQPGQYGSKDRNAVLVDARDGRILPGSGVDLGARDNDANFALHGLHAVMRTHNNLHRVTLPQGDVTAFKARLSTDSQRFVTSVETFGPWVSVRRYRTRARNQNFLHWTLRIDDPSYVLEETTDDGFIEGDRMFLHGDNKLRIIDLPTRKPVATYRLPGPLDRDRRTRYVSHQIVGGDLLVGSAMLIARSKLPERMRVDRFDMASGELQQSQLLTGNAFWSVKRGQDDTYWRHNQLVWVGGALLATHLHGLHIYTHADAPAPNPATLASGQGIGAIDGRIDDWPDDARVALLPGAVDGAELRLAAHQASLYVALTLPRPDPAPARGHGDAAGGDRLELAVGVEPSLRVQVSLGPDGRAQLIPLGTRELPGGSQAAVRHDPVTGKLTYELVIGLGVLRHRDDEDRLMTALSLIARGADALRWQHPLARLGRGIDGVETAPLRQHYFLLP